VQKLKGLADRVEKAEGEIQEVLNRATLPWTSSSGFSADEEEAGGVPQVSRKSNLKKDLLEEYERVIRNAQRKVRRVEAESNLQVGS